MNILKILKLIINFDQQEIFIHKYNPAAPGILS